MCNVPVPNNSLFFFRLSSTLKFIWENLNLASPGMVGLVRYEIIFDLVWN